MFSRLIGHENTLFQMSTSKCREKGFFLVNREQLGKQVVLGEGRREKGVMEGSQFLEIHSPCLHCLCTTSMIFFPPFYFLPNPCNPSARSLDNGIQQKLQEEILLQQNDQCSNIQPPS